ncbi:hypothetical protein A3G55_04625 [Candidatus Giovannonibacteria bacterium RIFCSPLOWO2_12_FULL_44_25]|uniref:Uncharacterized protein n=3 Tax=Parcubacteria group TaxID=1794811 RepID=A0A837IQK5_9BACT|nr:MAG: hypothetical protein UW15_C0017G0009 [Parcubacteria group bacterium GW2011_GWC1_44_10]KKT59859.1 MAG: hypothetical protein UW53_C0006G0006 [Candidatus Giovannonibacteria bacterium GW2011_GWA1_44_25]KKU11855.1 MAG: hypothetical protein UX18_C0039G0004 [Candidatus Azambacteria bacterium GW2011_GWC2_45_7b]KKU29845.1 MAG: hypothetical protein UX43_C0004G0006 [Candidatus Giovannonibacteria bacterium GW2011_GWB1_46_20]OGF48912.1 MAG: hypothetical protein A2120_04895 [Candidatus Giovannonibact
MENRSFFDFVKSISFSNADKERSILYLSILVENGIETFIDALKDESASPKEQAELEVAKLVFFVTEKDLQQNKFFDTALRIAVAKDAVRGDKEGLDHVELFFKRLSDIFPQGMADRLFLYAYDRIKEDAATGKPILPPYEELKQHSIERAKILGLETTAKTSKRSYRSEGTSTDIVPCPKCSDKKRVDKNTKRFRCKKCGLNQTYPF